MLNDPKGVLRNEVIHLFVYLSQVSALERSSEVDLRSRFVAEHEHKVTADGLGLLDEATDPDWQDRSHAYFYDRLFDLLRPQSQ